MKMKIHKICINFPFEIFFQVFFQMALLHVLHMDRPAQERHLQLIKLRNMPLMIFSKLLKIIQKPGFSCHFLKFMVENAWICSIIKQSYKYWKIKTTKLLYLDFKRKRQTHHLKFNKLLIMDIV